MSIDLLTFDDNKHWFDKSFEYPIKKKFRLPKCFKKTFYLNELFEQYPEVEVIPYYRYMHYPDFTGCHPNFRRCVEALEMYDIMKKYNIKDDNDYDYDMLF